MTRRFAELVLLCLGVEAVVLGVHHARTGAEPGPRALAGTLGAGAFLCLALRAEARRRSGVAPFLLGAGLCHAIDLRRRIERRG